MNRTLKETLTKLTLETGTDWVMLLCISLYRVRNSPYQLGLTPFEIIYGMPGPIVPNLKTDATAEGDKTGFEKCLRLLCKQAALKGATVASQVKKKKLQASVVIKIGFNR